MSLLLASMVLFATNVANASLACLCPEHAAPATHRLMDDSTEMHHAQTEMPCHESATLHNSDHDASHDGDDSHCTDCHCAHGMSVHLQTSALHLRAPAPSFVLASPMPLDPSRHAETLYHPPRTHA